MVWEYWDIEKCDFIVFLTTNVEKNTRPKPKRNGISKTVDQIPWYIQEILRENSGSLCVY